jgi:hypothetical protein
VEVEQSTQGGCQGKEVWLHEPDDDRKHNLTIGEELCCCEPHDMCKTQLVGSLLGIQVNRLLNRSELALGFLVLPKVFMLILVHL